MNLISNTKIDRTVVQLGEFKLIRIKNYSTIHGKSVIHWAFDGGEKIKPGFSDRLEKKFIKYSRKISSISV